MGKKKDVYHNYITGEDVKLGPGDKVVYLPTKENGEYIGQNEDGIGRIQLENGQILHNRENVNVHKWDKQKKLK